MEEQISTDQVAFLGSVATVLHGNGQQTGETMRTVARLAGRFGGDMLVLPGWGAMLLKPLTGTAAAGDVMAVTPNNVAINRVAAATALAEDVIAGRIGVAAARGRIGAVAIMPPVPTPLFALACATGAAALAVSFGVAHVAAVMLIFASAGLGGLVRRFIGRHGANGYAQAFAAALLAGLVGAASVHWHLSSDLRLIAVCPCMVLVPGPYLLNGTLDLLANRIPLGAARLLFAAVTLAAISAGLLIGLTLCGVGLPAAPAGRAVHGVAAVLAGAMAAACFSIFFSLPLRLVVWPVVAAMLADAARWGAMTWWHASPAVGAGLAALVVGAVLTPVARRHHLPFAGIGFAAIVSLVPGVLVFRLFGGLVALQDAAPGTALGLLQATVSDGLTASMVIAALTVGIVIPKHLFDAMTAAAGKRGQAAGAVGTASMAGRQPERRAPDSK